MSGVVVMGPSPVLLAHHRSTDVIIGWLLGLAVCRRLGLALVRDRSRRTEANYA
ncbi:hypothetical protein [Arsenicicoccus dermatophilus]|uniref:hypothetical protein n=1 Tax=Arsenicicoccus dermatophilus TaxID=1076331 RepID=UPI003916F63D